MIGENIAKLIEKVKEGGNNPDIVHRVLESINYCKGFESAQKLSLWDFAQEYLFRIAGEYEGAVGPNKKALEGAKDATLLGLAKFTEDEMNKNLGLMLAYLSRSPKI